MQNRAPSQVAGNAGIGRIRELAPRLHPRLHLRVQSRVSPGHLSPTLSAALPLLSLSLVRYTGGSCRPLACAQVAGVSLPIRKYQLSSSPPCPICPHPFPLRPIPSSLPLSLRRCRCGCESRRLLRPVYSPSRPNLSPGSSAHTVRLLARRTDRSTHALTSCPAGASATIGGGGLHL